MPHTGRVRLATRQTGPPKARVRNNLELSYLETKGTGISKPTQMPDGEAEVLAATKQGNAKAAQAAIGGPTIRSRYSQICTHRKPPTGEDTAVSLQMRPPTGETAAAAKQTRTQPRSRAPDAGGTSAAVLP